MSMDAVVVLDRPASKGRRKFLRQPKGQVIRACISLLQQQVFVSFLCFPLEDASGGTSGSSFESFVVPVLSYHPGRVHTFHTSDNDLHVLNPARTSCSSVPTHLHVFGSVKPSWTPPRRVTHRLPPPTRRAPLLLARAWPWRRANAREAPSSCAKRAPNTSKWIAKERCHGRGPPLNFSLNLRVNFELNCVDGETRTTHRRWTTDGET